MISKCEWHDYTGYLQNGQKLYLSSIMNIRNDKIIAYHLTSRPLPSMVNTMLTDAMKLLAKDERLLLHSAQGRQYQMPQLRASSVH